MTAEMAVAALGARAVFLLVAADQVSAGEAWIGGSAGSVAPEVALSTASV